MIGNTISWRLSSFQLFRVIPDVEATTHERMLHALRDRFGIGIGLFQIGNDALGDVYIYACTEVER